MFRSQTSVERLAPLWILLDHFYRALDDALVENTAGLRDALDERRLYAQHASNISRQIWKQMSDSVASFFAGRGVRCLGLPATGTPLFHGEAGALLVQPPPTSGQEALVDPQNAAASAANADEWTQIRNANVVLRRQLRTAHQSCEGVYRSIFGHDYPYAEGAGVFSRVAEELQESVTALVAEVSGARMNVAGSEEAAATAPTWSTPLDAYATPALSLADIVRQADFIVSTAQRSSYDMTGSRPGGQGFSDVARLGDQSPAAGSTVDSAVVAGAEARMQQLTRQHQVNLAHVQRLLDQERRQSADFVRAARQEMDEVRRASDERMARLAAEKEEAVRRVVQRYDEEVAAMTDDFAERLQQVHNQQDGDKAFREHEETSTSSRAIMLRQLKESVMKQVQSSLIASSEETTLGGDGPALRRQSVRSTVEAFSPAQEYGGESPETLRTLLPAQRAELDFVKHSFHLQTKQHAMQWETLLREVIQKYDGELSAVQQVSEKEVTRGNKLRRTLDESKAQIESLRVELQVERDSARRRVAELEEVCRDEVNIARRQLIDERAQVQSLHQQVLACNTNLKKSLESEDGVRQAMRDLQDMMTHRGWSKVHQMEQAYPEDFGFREVHEATQVALDAALALAMSKALPTPPPVAVFTRGAQTDPVAIVSAPSWLSAAPPPALDVEAIDAASSSVVGGSSPLRLSHASSAPPSSPTVTIASAAGGRLSSGKLAALTAFKRSSLGSVKAAAAATPGARSPFHEQRSSLVSDPLGVESCLTSRSVAAIDSAATFTSSLIPSRDAVSASSRRESAANVTPSVARRPPWKELVRSAMQLASSSDLGETRDISSLDDRLPQQLTSGHGHPAEGEFTNTDAAHVMLSQPELRRAVESLPLKEIDVETAKTSSDPDAKMLSARINQALRLPPVLFGAVPSDVTEAMFFQDALKLAAACDFAVTLPKGHASFCKRVHSSMTEAAKASVAATSAAHRSETFFSSPLASLSELDIVRIVTYISRGDIFEAYAVESPALRHRVTCEDETPDGAAHEEPRSHIALPPAALRMAEDIAQICRGMPVPLDVHQVTWDDLAKWGSLPGSDASQRGRLRPRLPAATLKQLVLRLLDLFTLLKHGRQGFSDTATSQMLPRRGSRHDSVSLPGEAGRPLFLAGPTLSVMTSTLRALGPHPPRRPLARPVQHLVAASEIQAASAAHHVMTSRVASRREDAWRTSEPLVKGTQM